MKKWILALAVCYTTLAFGQEYKTGDSELDAALKSVLTEAKKDLTTFKADLGKRFNVGVSKVEECFKAGMDAAEAFLAFELAEITKKPVEDVINVYKKDKSKGWGELAKELGIKPGSPEFHALKAKTKNHENKEKRAPQNKGQAKKK